MLYFVVFLIGFLLSGIWIACNIFISQRLKRSETVLMFRPLFSGIIPTIVVYLLIGDHPFHFETLLDYRVWIIAAAAVAATCVIMTLGPQKNETYKAAELMEMCVEAACMEIPQRAMMQTFVLWLLEKWDLNPICCILINALIWCAGILFQAVVIQKQSAVKKLTIELISSFVFSIGVGYVFYTAGCILLPMAAHASERFLMNYHRKTARSSTE